MGRKIQVSEILEFTQIEPLMEIGYSMVYSQFNSDLMMENMKKC